MSRTGLLRSLRRMLSAADVARRTGQRPADVLAAATRRGVTRRDVLRSSAGAAVLLPLAACGDDSKGDTLEVAVIGGGVAGLHCAYRLVEAGVEATVFEASPRVGGRMYTGRGLFAGGQICELGGELVDTSHTVLQGLVSDFGLTLDNLPEATAGLRQDTYHFGGGVIADQDIVDQFTPLAATMASAVTAAEADDVEFARVDAMSIPEWLETEGGLGTTSLIRRILEMAYLGEYGLEVAEQSIFNLLYLVDYTTPDPFRVYGDSDEVFHIHEGNEAVPTALAAALTEARIQLEHALTKVTLRADGRYDLELDGPNGAVAVTATHVVFALPFTRLRTVDLTEAGLPAEKLDVIQNLGYGMNAKLMIGFDSRPWADATNQAGGTTITDVGQLQQGWDSTRGQDGTRGIYTNFVGGDRGISIGDGAATDRAAEAVPWIDTVFPGAAAAYTDGGAVRMHWPTHPFTLGSYACYRPGQWSYFGTEGQRAGNLHFCGEHTSQEYQGYMEGGAETGGLVATEILDDLGAKPSPRLLQLLAPRLRGPQACYHAGLYRGARRRWRPQARRALFR